MWEPGGGEAPRRRLEVDFRGARATWGAEDAGGPARRNAGRSGAPVGVARGRRGEPEPLLRAAPWDLVLGADLLYEARNAEQLAGLIERAGYRIAAEDR